MTWARTLTSTRIRKQRNKEKEKRKKEEAADPAAIGRMIKKICGAGLVLLSVLSIALLILCLCGWNGKTEKEDAQGAQYEAVEKYDFSQEDPEKILSAFNYADSGFLEGVTAEAVTQEDVESDLAAYLSAYPVYEKITDRAVTEGDMLCIDYACVDRETGYEVSGGTVENLLLDISDNDLPQEVKDAFPGRMPGAAFTKEAVMGETDGSFEDGEGNEVSLTGRTLAFSFTIHYICGAQRTPDTLTDEDVEAVTEGDYRTVPEFMEFIRESIQSSRDAEIAESVWDRWTVSCEIKDAEAFRACADREFAYEMGYYQERADRSGMDLASLAALYGTDSVEAFEEMVRQDSETIVKQYLISYYVAGKEGILLDDAALLARAESFAEDYGMESVEELKTAYGWTELRLFLQMERVDEWIAREFFHAREDAPESGTQEETEEGTQG